MSRIAAGLLSVVIFVTAVVAISSPGYGYEAKRQLDINTATAEELDEVPGIDIDSARNILAYRDVNGPFSTVDDLLKVEGMDEEKMKKARMYLTVGQQPKLGW